MHKWTSDISQKHCRKEKFTDLQSKSESIKSQIRYVIKHLFLKLSISINEEQFIMAMKYLPTYTFEGSKCILSQTRKLKSLHDNNENQEISFTLSKNIRYHQRRCLEVFELRSYDAMLNSDERKL
ncbi:CLUMA_CG016659, isoform A [Clunio marinus]|uniref:CLUMA_CG016659, isoform A n=1 Tax=Clunio marinus TaxID=568069 RepID=A0A1J1IUS4_9DIPT|nr:CLUMA_CG016659, isoform A [Clunio marinus]